MTAPSAPSAASDQALESSMLARAARILYSFTSTTPELSMSDVVRRTGLPRSSVHRIMDQLVRLRALERTGTRYRLGLGLIELGALAAHQNRLREVSLPHLHRLHDAIGAPVRLAVLDGPEIVYLEQIGGLPGGRVPAGRASKGTLPARGVAGSLPSRPVPGGSVPSGPGSRRPAHCTAAGKAMLAFADEEELAEVLAAGLPAQTPYTITEARALRRELARVRDHGIALDRQESRLGVGCVAAPLRDATGRPVAAISVTGPAATLNPHRLARPLLTTLRTIWLTLFTLPRRRASSRTPDAEPRSAPPVAWQAGALDEMVSWPKLTDWI